MFLAFGNALCSIPYENIKTLVVLQSEFFLPLAMRCAVFHMKNIKTLVVLLRSRGSYCRPDFELVACL
jgi:hypothetical protein